MTGLIMKVVNDFSSMSYFTIQSNLLVGITSLLFIFNYSGKNYSSFKLLSSISVLNIFTTFLVGNLLLPFNSTFPIILLHIVAPVLYLFLYLFYIEDHLLLKNFWVLLIYPLIYAIISIIVNLTNGVALYPFFDVKGDFQNIIMLIILTFGFGVISFLLVYIKHIIEKKIYK
jgi:hypothetical protein